MLKINQSSAFLEAHYSHKTLSGFIDEAKGKSGPTWINHHETVRGGLAQRKEPIALLRIK